MGLGMAASIFGAGTTHPTDLVRVRMQAQTPYKDGTLKYRNPIQGMWQIAAEEGFWLRGLFKGLAGTTALQCTYSTFRYGTYEPIKRALGEEEGVETPLYKKVLAGAICGFFASGFSNPCDLIKTRMQASPPGMNESFLWHAREIYTHHGGMFGFYKGVRVTVLRAMLLNSTYLSSYDEVKHTVMRVFNQNDNFLVQLIGAVASGFIVACATTPADNVKTRIMTQKHYNDIPTLTKVSMSYYQYYPREKYSGVVDCARQMLKYEGPRVFLRGFTAIWMSLAPFFILSLLAWEQLRLFCGIKGV